MSSHNRDRRRRDKLPPPQFSGQNIDEIDKKIIIDEIGVHSWTRARDGQGPAEMVVLDIVMNADGQAIHLLVRLGTPEATDRVIAALQRHRRDVWPNVGPTLDDLMPGD